MGFDIKVESELGRGTTFKVAIRTLFKMKEPLQQQIHNEQRSLRLMNSQISIKSVNKFSGLISRQSHPQPSINSELLNQNVSISQRTSYKILVANDEPFQLTFMRSFLENTHPANEVVSVMNGDQAVKLVQKNMNEFHNFKQTMNSNKPEHFDAIILDLNMPIMDGFEALL